MLRNIALSSRHRCRASGARSLCALRFLQPTDRELPKAYRAFDLTEHRSRIFFRLARGARPSLGPWIVRPPLSHPDLGWSLTLLDAGTQFLEHLEGAGREKGRLGVLFVALTGGTRFSVGTGFSDVGSGAPRVGSVISFRCQDRSDSGIPRFTSCIGDRGDAT